MLTCGAVGLLPYSNRVPSTHRSTRIDALVFVVVVVVVVVLLAIPQSRDTGLFDAVPVLFGYHLVRNRHKIATALPNKFLDRRRRRHRLLLFLWEDHRHLHIPMLAEKARELLGSLAWPRDSLVGTIDDTLFAKDGHYVGVDAQIVASTTNQKRDFSTVLETTPSVVSSPPSSVCNRACVAVSNGLSDNRRRGRQRICNSGMSGVSCLP